MLTRHHHKSDTESTAIYSRCEAYRYSLSRVWNHGTARALFVLLNPSTATELQNDPTVERCERRARALGFGSFVVTNVFAYRATDPQVMRRQPDPVGPANDSVILAAAETADQIVCAWGSHGVHLDRAAQVTALLRATGRPLFHLGLTRAGQPKHPLYISYSVQPMLWQHPRW